MYRSTTLIKKHVLIRRMKELLDIWAASIQLIRHGIPSTQEFKTQGIPNTTGLAQIFRFFSVRKQH